MNMIFVSFREELLWAEKDILRFNVEWKHHTGSGVCRLVWLWGRDGCVEPPQVYAIGRHEQDNRRNNISIRHKYYARFKSGQFDDLYGYIQWTGCAAHVHRQILFPTIGDFVEALLTNPIRVY